MGIERGKVCPGRSSSGIRRYGRDWTSPGEFLDGSETGDRRNPRSCGIPELEIVAPGNVLEDLRFARRLKEEGLRITTSGLIYSFNQGAGRKSLKSAGVWTGSTC